MLAVWAWAAGFILIQLYRNLALMNEQQAEKLLEVLSQLVQGGDYPKGFEGLTMAIGDPQLPDHNVTEALREIAAGLHDVAEAIREIETGNPSIH